jgi:hypothetical protein
VVATVREADIGGFSVPVISGPAKDCGGRFSVPPQGPRLIEFIRADRQAGRPALHVADDIWAPLLPWTAEAARPPASAKLPRPALVAMRYDDPEAWALAISDERGRSALRKLTAAALRDLLGLGLEEIAERLGYADERSARRAAAAGRMLWPQLGAWPWWRSEPGALPHEWWRDEATAERLFKWHDQVAWKAWRLAIGRLPF